MLSEHHNRVPQTTTRLTGQPTSGGVAIGRAVHLWPTPPAPPPPPVPVRAVDESARLKTAAAATAAVVRELREQTRARLGEAKAEIFDVQLALLADPEFLDRVHELIRTRAIAASAALREVTQAFTEELSATEDERFAARAADLRDLAERLETALACDATPAPEEFDGDVIIVAPELTPSQTAQLDLAHVRGFITELGSAHSHAAILARGLGLPAVMRVPQATTIIPRDTTLCLDGTTGEILLSPSLEQISACRKQLAHQSKARIGCARHPHRPSQTADGRPLPLGANVGRLEDITGAMARGAEHIGLFRSELSYLGRNCPPGEEELSTLYGAMLARAAPHAVTIRTLDLGGDKQVEALTPVHEANPFLGVRGVRLCLQQEVVFRAQLRALWRASVRGRLKIMLPMVTVVAEVRTVRKWLAEERAGLVSRGEPVARDLPLGIMIETPAAALTADALAREVDFFSIGTNDLTQYTMAADRLNGQLAHLQAAHHPAVLQLIQRAVEAAHRHGKRVSVCGEMGSHALGLPVLDGLGVDEISMPPDLIPEARARLARLDHAANVRLARECVGLGSAEQVAAAVAATSA